MQKSKSGSRGTAARSKNRQKRASEQKLGTPKQRSKMRAKGIAHAKAQKASTPSKPKKSSASAGKQTPLGQAALDVRRAYRQAKKAHPDLFR